MASDNSQDDTIPTAPQGAAVDFDLDDTRTLVQPLTSAGGSPAVPSGNHVALPVSFTLLEYTLEAVLGVGGFGITYLAQDNNLQCRVAIKEYLPNDLALRVAGQTVIPRSDADIPAYQLGLERFLAEARVLATFRHHNIVRVSRFFEANQTAYMVMDYEHGESLRNWRENHGEPNEATLVGMFLPLLEGLETVHRAGVVHRDIKPANIYVRDADGSLVLLDFGAARQTTGGSSKSLTSIITPGYAPFEQYHARGAQGPWTDLYALAGVLYWLITGQKPLEAPTRIKDDTMAPATEAGSGRFSSAFLAAIDWALTVDEETRPRSVAEFRPVLLGQIPTPRRPTVPATVTTSPSVPAPVSSPPAANAGNRATKFAVVAVVVAVVAALGFFARQKPPPQPGSAPPVVSSDRSLSINAVAEPKERTSMASDRAGAERSPPKTVAKAPAPAAAAGGPVATLLFDIVPAGEYGEVTVDGRKIGTAPPLRELKVTPGKHKIEIHGSKPPNVYYYWVNLEPNEKKKLWAKFANE